MTNPTHSHALDLVTIAILTFVFFYRDWLEDKDDE